MGDARVTVRLDMTIPHPTVQYANVKPGVEIGPLDPSAPAEEIEAELQAGIDLAVKAFETIDDGMETVLRRLVSPEANIPGLRGKLAEVEAMVKSFGATQEQVVSRLKSYDLPDLVARVRGGDGDVGSTGELE